MTTAQTFITIGIFAFSVHFTRFLPFLVFGGRDKLPKIIEYLGKVLPAAIMGLLVVYCFKDFDFTQISVVIPAAAASAATVLLHLWKRNTILSILIGTAVYMVLIRVM